MEHNTKQLTRAAMFYGIFMGAFWVLKDLFLMAGVYYPVFGTVYTILSPITLVLAYTLTKVYKILIGGKITFAQAWRFGTLLYIFAGLIEALPQYAFYRFILPDGYLEANAQQIITIAEQFYPNMDMTEVTAQMTSPIKLTLAGLVTNMLYGIILSVPVAALLQRSVIDINQFKRKL